MYDLGYNKQKNKDKMNSNKNNVTINGKSNVNMKYTMA